MQSCFTAVKAPHGLSKLLEEKVGLGCGESESIAPAYTSGTTILVDDLKARKTAKKLGCRMSGTIGVLHRMQRQGLISSVYEEMSKLKNMGFRVSVPSAAWQSARTQSGWQPGKAAAGAAGWNPASRLAEGLLCTMRPMVKPRQNLPTWMRCAAWNLRRMAAA